MATGHPAIDLPVPVTRSSSKPRLAAAFDGLSERSGTGHGMLALWLILGCSAWIIANIHVPSIATYGSGGLLTSSAALNTLRFVFLASAAWWAFGLFVPASSWVAFGSHFVLSTLVGQLDASLAAQSATFNWLLLAFALWYQLDAGPIRQAMQKKQLSSSQLFPEWVQFLCVFAILMECTASGVNKLLVSGLFWADGLSLQLWMQVLANPDNPVVTTLIEDRWVANVLQVLLLTAECFAFFALLTAGSRIFFGLLLVTTYSLTYLQMGILPVASILPMALFLLPLRTGTPWLAPRVIPFTRKMLGFDE